MKAIPALFLCCLLALQSAWGGELALKLGRHSIHAEVADTEASRLTGLMRREHLCADCGMLFVFPAAARYSFWMKDTPVRLSIAFIAADGRIINIAEMQPNTTEFHTAESDALYTLEMNSGWFARHGIKSGDQVDGLEHAPPGR